MRALCAAIITAGALIGLGLAAIGVGARYQSVGVLSGNEPYIHWKQLDTALMFILVALATTLLAGLAATFLGLAYHHERRHYERHGSVAGAKTGVNLHD